MSVAASAMLVPWGSTPRQQSCRPNTLVLLDGCWPATTGLLSPSEGWNEHPQARTAGEKPAQREPASNRKRAVGVRQWRPDQNSLPGPGYRRRLPLQKRGLSEAALAVGPLRVTSIVVKPLAHGELYRRPPARVSGLEPLKSSAALSDSLAPIEPHGFNARLLDNETLCVGSGISRGPAITSRATAVRHRQLQFRHRMHQTTHKSARLVHLISAIREHDASSPKGRSGGGSSG